MLLQPPPACAFTAPNLATRNELRGACVSFFNVTASPVGSVAGPVLIPALSDHLFRGPSGSGRGMATTIT